MDLTPPTPRPAATAHHHRPSLFPPSHIAPHPTNTFHLPAHLRAPHALRVPTTWRCGTCGAAQPVLELMMPMTGRTAAAGHAGEEEETSCCATPALQAVYDQFGHIYLFWRDDPAVADLRDPGMAREARRRVRQAGGACWEEALLLLLPEVEGGPVGEQEQRGEGGMRRRWTCGSQTSTASDESEDSLDSEMMATAE